MLLIHVPKLTNRLGYTLNVVFQRLLRTEIGITTDEEYFLGHEGAKVCYGHKRLGDSLFIKSHALLFQTSIEDQEPRAECRDGQWILFPTYGRDLDFGFDLLAATFYLISRYEEYLPHREDAHGRFLAEESLARRAGFLEEPVVEQWAQMLRRRLQERYPDLPLAAPGYRFVQTVDIDAAWCYLHKGLFRTLMGLGRDLFVRRDPGEVRRRIRVLLRREADPYDTCDYIIESQKRAPGSHLLFFVLLADYGQFDKPASYLNPHMRELVQHLDDYAKMGIHPGYQSLEVPARADAEIKRLEAIIHRTIVRARFHFLRLRLPRSYRILLHAGIRHDYTMGYPDAPGFRAGISVQYPFYDLERDMETELTIHPFCVMDTTLHESLGLSAQEGLQRCRKLVESLRAVGGTFCCVVHNQYLADRPEWHGWRDAYGQMLDMAKP